MNNQSLFAKVRSVLILLVSLLAVSTVWAEAPSQETITYIGWNGEETLTEDYTVLVAASSSNTTGVPFTPSTLWYVVSGEVSYDCSDFNFAEQRVKLLLMDGAKLTVTNGDEGCVAEFLDLNIYAQSLGENMGQFEVLSLKVTNAFNVLSGTILTTGGVEAATVFVNNGSVSIGGGVKANSVEFQNGSVSIDGDVNAGDVEFGNGSVSVGGGIEANSVGFGNGSVSIDGDVNAGDVEFGNGSVSVGGGIEAKHVRFYNGTVVVAEGVSTVSDADTVSACIQFAGATVRANSYSVSNLCEAKVGDNLLYGDEQGNAYSGALSAKQLASIAGKKVAPAKKVTFVDGSSVSEKAWIPGVVPSASTRYLGTFVGWYTDKSYETPFDFTNFESGATAYAKWEDLVKITYIDENGVTQTLTEDYTALVPASSSSASSSSGAASSSSGVSSSGSASSSSSTTGVPFSASSGWYVVSGEVSYNCSDFNFAGKDVKFILMDGASLAVENSDDNNCAKFASLHIYAQSLGENMGQFEVSSLNVTYAFNVLSGAILTTGDVYATSVFVNNGSVSVGGGIEAKHVRFYNGTVVVAEGVSAVSNADSVKADIQFAGATVRAKSYSVSGNFYEAKVGDNLVYVDEQGNEYRGTLDAVKIALMAGKTLSLAKTITFVDGSSVTEKVWVPGVVPSEPTRIWKKFIGWYTDKSYETPFDFMNFESGAYAYAKWEDLVEITYIDENGVTQTLTEDYTALVPASSSSGPTSGSSAGVPFTPSDGWYVVSGKIYYNCSEFNFAGKNVNLILMDDAWLTFECNNSEGSAEFGNLTIYAQSLGKKMGGLRLSLKDENKKLSLNVADKFVVNGGEISADAIVTRNAEFNKGSVAAYGEIVIKQTDENFAGIKGIKLAGATVKAYSYTIPEGDKYSIAVAPDLIYVNEDDEYSGTLSAEQLASIDDKELSPAKMVKFVDGNSVSNKAVILGEIPCTPVAHGKKFRWYADKSYQELFDFTNFNSGAIAYGLWEDLTDVTYLDENGEKQSVTPDYELVGTECADSELFTNSGWVLVNSEVSYENGFAFTAENLHLILADDAKLTVKNKTSFNNLAIYAQSTGVNQGVFEVNADSYAIFVIGALTINGGVVKATGGVNGIEGSSVKINDGVVKAFGKQAIYAHGDSLVVNGGTVEAHGTGERPGSGSGLSSNGYVDINGGTVTATGGYAINAYGDVTIAGGKVNATSSIYNIEGDNYVCFGIGSYESDVYLKGGTVTALAEDGCRGIYADNSMHKTIYLSGATVKASSYNDSILVAKDMSYYDDLGNSYTGIIYEEGLLELANKYVYPPALIITKNAEKTVATLDGNFDKDMPVVITQETTVDEVILNRDFTAGRYATVMFPFDVYADNLIGAKLIDKFDHIDSVKNASTGKLERIVAHTNAFWDKPAEAPNVICDNTVKGCKASVLLEANTPYMVQLEEGHTTLEIRGSVLLKTNAPEFAFRYGDWEFVGVYQYKKWTEDDAELQTGRAVYGFAGQTLNGYKIGDFVRIKAGASINPMRAYLRYNPLPKQSNAPNMLMAPRSTPSDLNDVKSIGELPKMISVVRDDDGKNGSEQTTVIGQLNTRTGEFTLHRSVDRVFNLKGQAYSKDARKARGAYYGKKVLK